LKGFVSTFFACIFICLIAIFLFSSFLYNIWAMIVFVAFILAMVITAFMNQESRIVELESDAVDKFCVTIWGC